MKQASRSAEVIRFHVFEVDTVTGELRKHGLRIKLQEQPFQVLSLLLARPGELVTREELRKMLWPADTFVDFEHGLNKTINKLREALSDDKERPRYIETLPRRGYRFVATVSSAQPPSEPSGPNGPPAVLVPQPAPAVTANPRRLHWMTPALVLLLGGLPSWLQRSGIDWPAGKLIRRLRPPLSRSARWQSCHSRIFPARMTRSTSLTG